MHCIYYYYCIRKEVNCVYYTTNLASDIKSSYNKRAVISNTNSDCFRVRSSSNDHKSIYCLGNANPIVISKK